MYIPPDTGIVPLSLKVILAGIPFTPVPRIAGAIIYMATDPNPATNGSAWLLTDDGPVFMVPKEEFKMGVYKIIDDRKNSLLKYVAFLTGCTTTQLFPRITAGLSFCSTIFYKLLGYLWWIPLILGGLTLMMIYDAVWPIII